MLLFNKQINIHLRDKFEYWYTGSLFGKKLSGKNRPYLLLKGVIRELITRYGEEADDFDHENGRLGRGLLHFAFISQLRPQKILCLGSYEGFIPAVCALACCSNNYGHVDFVGDDYSGEGLKYWEGLPWWKIEKPEDHFSFLDIDKRILFFKKNTFEKKLKSHNFEKYDYVFININRSTTTVSDELEMVNRVSKPDCFVIAHETGIEYKSALPKFNIKDITDNERYSISTLDSYYLLKLISFS